MKLEMPYLDKIPAKGREYYYYRRDGVRTPIKDDEGKNLSPGDPGFLAAYNAIHLPIEAKEAARQEKPGPGSLYALVTHYLDEDRNKHFAQLSARTKSDYAKYMGELRAMYGYELVCDLTTETVIDIQDEFADTYRRANYYVQCISILANFARRRPSVYGLEHNPAEPVGMLKGGKGYPPWPLELIDRFRNKAYDEITWVMESGLWTGQRGQDLVRMARSDFDQGLIAVHQEKGGEKLWIPCHTDYQKVIADIEIRGPLLHTTKTHRAWSPGNLRNEIREWVQECDFTGYSIHGLRKNATVNLFEAGCTPQEAQAITGHKTLQMLELYGRDAQKKVLAQSAIAKLEAYTAKLAGTDQC